MVFLDHFFFPVEAFKSIFLMNYVLHITITDCVDSC